jgi:pheromone shutdown-related protein TraB
MDENSETQIRLELKTKTILLVGTAHVSRGSVEEVKRVINDEKPDVVCVEIDASRYNAMTHNENWEKLDIVKVIKEGKGFLLIANLVLSSFQRRLGEELGVKPGEEMLGAVQAAQSLNLPFVFCDREIQLTLRRAWGECGLWSKCKLLSVLFASAFSGEKLSETEIENLKKNTELDGMMNELAKFLPAVKKTLIDERDLYLATKIWTSLSTDAEKNSAVAVVGAGHLNGIKEHLKSLSEIDNGGADAAASLSEIEKIPKGGIISKCAQVIVPLVIVGFIAYGFYKGGTEKGLSDIVKWVILNGGFAALGSLFGAAHILTIIVTFISAPIGTLNPFLSVGIFAALCEAMLRRPRVSDAENLNSDASGIRGIYKNRILRVLLIFVLSSLGGVLGNVLTITPLGNTIVNTIINFVQGIAK